MENMPGNGGTPITLMCNVDLRAIRSCQAVIASQPSLTRNSAMEISLRVVTSQAGKPFLPTGRGRAGIGLWGPPALSWQPLHLPPGKVVGFMEEVLSSTSITSYIQYCVQDGWRGHIPPPTRERSADRLGSTTAPILSGGPPRSASSIVDPTMFTNYPTLHTVLWATVRFKRGSFFAQPKVNTLLKLEFVLRVLKVPLEQHHLNLDQDKNSYVKLRIMLDG